MKLNLSTIVLAAGEGKRMKSSKSKVLHKIAGKEMLARTVETLKELTPAQIIVVANPANAQDLKRILPSSVEFVIQEKPLGTADAVKIGLNSIQSRVDQVAVLYGDDTAFYKSSTILEVFNEHLSSNSDITLVTLKVKNPHGLGRIVRNRKSISIVEEKDATHIQKKISEVNDGLYFFKKTVIADLLPEIKPSKVTNELYVTDTIALAHTKKLQVSAHLLKKSEWHGVNTPIELARANFRHKKSIHIMGIAGAGASAVAAIAKAYGFEVTGCDLHPKGAYLDTSDIEVETGHSDKHIHDGISCLVVSPAVEIFDSQNPELIRAREEGIPVLTWQQFQGHILQEDKFTIAIAGAYGKSTTTAMISKVLEDAGLDPTCEIGAKVLGWDRNYRIGKSKYYVCEADEYNDNFLSYHPNIAVILNVAWDHPDYFKSQEAVIASYEKFIRNIKNNGTLVIGNDLKLEVLVSSLKENDRKDLKIVKLESFKPITLKLIGQFRQINANAALTVANVLKIDTNIAEKSLNNFEGVGRRLEKKGQIGKTTFYDDYAVQPFTIEKTANALKEKYADEKVLLVLEPHMPSRVNMFFNNFVKSLKNTNVDHIFITNTYLARESGNVEELSKKLTSEIDGNAEYSGSIDETSEKIKQNLGKYDVICSMGAGDAYKIYDKVLNG